MAVSIVKETIELPSVTTDSDGNAFVTKRINLKGGQRHQLLQVDMYSDAFPSATYDVETVITAYPAIPTNMDYDPAGGLTNRYPAGGDNSILFKERRNEIFNSLSSGVATQFPSSEIAANNATLFYTDHVYINMHIMGAANTTFSNIAYSFLMVLNDKSVPLLEHSIGVLQESHDAMCALLMSNGHMQSISNLRGNTFPMWRYGGMRPEYTITPTAANSFFLDIDTRDSEEMITTSAIRQSVADARRMGAFDSAFGDRRPDWLTMDLNQGIVAGAIRADPIPLKYADNGNTRMF
jgi:hypothetical protein